MDSGRYEKQHTDMGYRRLIQQKEGKRTQQSRMDYLLYQDGPTINGHLLGEVKHSELFLGGDVRTLRVTPICASSSGVPQGGTMVINDLLQ